MTSCLHRKLGSLHQSAEQLVTEQTASNREAESRFAVKLHGFEQAGFEGPVADVGERRSGGRVCVHPPIQSQRQDHALRAGDLGGEHFGVAGRQRRRATRRRPHQSRNIWLHSSRVPAPRDAVEGVRPRPNRFVSFTLPVHKVVAALMSGPSPVGDRKSTRLNSSHANISYAVFCLKKKTT